MEAFPGVFVDLRFEAGFKGAVGIAGARKAGVADKETFFVVIGVVGTMGPLNQRAIPSGPSERISPVLG